MLSNYLKLIPGGGGTIPDVMSSVPLDVYTELSTARQHPRTSATPAHPLHHPRPAPGRPEDPPAPGSPFRGVEAVAFDLDGTLVDFVGMKETQCTAAARALRRAGLRRPVAAMRDHMLRLVFHELDVEWDGVVAAFLIDTLGHVDDALHEAGQDAWEAAEREVEAFPGVETLLRTLRARGKRLAVVTDAPGPKARKRLRCTGLHRYFDVVLTRSEHPGGKGDPTPFRDLLARWDLAPEAVAMVGDNPLRDVRSARALGLPTVLARYGFQQAFASDRPGDRAEAEVGHPRDLLEVLPAEPVQAS